MHLRSTGFLLPSSWEAIHWWDQNAPHSTLYCRMFFHISHLACLMAPPVPPVGLFNSQILTSSCHLSMELNLTEGGEFPFESSYQKWDFVKQCFSLDCESLCAWESLSLSLSPWTMWPLQELLFWKSGLAKWKSTKVPREILSPWFLVVNWWSLSFCSAPMTSCSVQYIIKCKRLFPDTEEIHSTSSCQFPISASALVCNLSGVVRLQSLYISLEVMCTEQSGAYFWVQILKVGFSALFSSFSVCIYFDSIANINGFIYNYLIEAK